MPRIYTKTGDDGTTGLLYGGRVRKDAPAPVAYGAVDEAQAAKNPDTARAKAPRSPGCSPGSRWRGCTARSTNPTAR